MKELFNPKDSFNWFGIDLAYRVDTEKFKETAAPTNKPSPTIVEKFEKAEFGKKQVKDFHNNTTYCNFRNSNSKPTI